MTICINKTGLSAQLPKIELPIQRRAPFCMVFCMLPEQIVITGDLVSIRQYLADKPLHHAFIIGFNRGRKIVNKCPSLMGQYSDFNFNYRIGYHSKNKLNKFNTIYLKINDNEIYTKKIRRFPSKYLTEFAHIENLIKKYLAENPQQIRQKRRW